MLFITLSADSYRLASLHDSSSKTYNLEASLPSEKTCNEESKDRNRSTLKTETELRENTAYSSFSHGMDSASDKPPAIVATSGPTVP